MTINSVESLAVNFGDNDDDEIIDRIFDTARRETENTNREIQNTDTNTQNTNTNTRNLTETALTSGLDANSDSMSVISLEPIQLVSTNHFQPDNENNGIPIVDDAIERQQKQFYIRSTPGAKYRVENRATNSKVVTKDVFIPINNTERKIITFLKEHTIADRVFHCYFFEEHLYLAFSRVYTTVFNERGPKLFRCTSRVTFVDNKTTARYYQKIPRRQEHSPRIQETYKHIRRNYHWSNMLLSVQAFVNKCDTCLKAKYERIPLRPPLI